MDEYPLSDTCKWLHEQLEPLPIFKYPFDLEMLPKNGVYFFYEEGENSKHGKGISRPRIVRIGTHQTEHYLGGYLVTYFGGVNTLL